MPRRSPQAYQKQAFNNTPPPEFLIGRDTNLSRWLDFCPSAKTLTAWSATENCQLIIQLRCKRWQCPHCGHRRIRATAAKVAETGANKLLTLTVNPALYETPREAYDSTRRQVAPFARWWRTEAGQFEYMRVLELTKKGWPHYHFVARAGFLPQHHISAKWDQLTGAPIVDVRSVKKETHVFSYVLKYLGKQKYIPWTNRRITYSKHFFPPNKPHFDHGLELLGPRTTDLHPVEWITEHHSHGTIRRLTPDTITVDKPPAHQTF